jgi:hypothetical protein
MYITEIPVFIFGVSWRCCKRTCPVRIYTKAACDNIISTLPHNHEAYVDSELQYRIRNELH